MTDHGARLERHYDEMSTRFDTTTTGDYSQLVTPSGNANEPIHRWFHLKEAYSHRLLARVLKDVGLAEKSSLTILDPFAGSGTTFVSAGQLVQEGFLEYAAVTGTETNPFLHLLASTKLRALTEVANDFLLKAGAIAASATRLTTGSAPPTLSTFREEYFPRHAMDALLRLKRAIDETEHGTLTYDLLRLCLAAAVEPASRLRKDGRALRVVAGREPTDPIRTFLDVATVIAEDIPLRPAAISGTIEPVDIRSWTLPSEYEGAADLAVFSPPYPNNIDYTEVYKAEAWFLGLIKNHHEFATQRRKTLRSHGSLNWNDEYFFTSTKHSAALCDAIDPILKAIPSDRYRLKRTQLVKGYVDDMYRCMETVAASLRRGGQAACVVGNSLHGHSTNSFVIASDLLIAVVAELHGLRVTRVDVARVPTRRRTHSKYLRESVVFMERPGT